MRWDAAREPSCPWCTVVPGSYERYRTVNDEDLTRGISRAVADRMARLKPKPDVQKVLQRLERNATLYDARDGRTCGVHGRRRRTPGLRGRAAQRADDRRERPSLSDGVPAAAPGAPIDPEDSALATAAYIAPAVRRRLRRGSPHEQRNAAVQDGKRFESLRAEAIDLAVQRGFLAEQLARETIEVHDVSLVDRTRAIVRFTISIPPRGPLLVDQIGYAVQEGGRWKVSLRTACDLLSLGGLGKPCPPP